jgi:hypothetical protein
MSIFSSLHKRITKSYPKEMKVIRLAFESGDSRNVLNKFIQESYPVLAQLLLNKCERSSLYYIKLEEFYEIFYGIKGAKCLECKSPTGFSVHGRRYKEFCSKSCYNKSPENKKRREATVLKRYGVANAFQNEELKAKSKRTMNERFGVDNPSQSEEIKLKKRNTFKQNWGADHYMRSEKGRNKLKRTFQDKYGVDNPMQVLEIAERVRATLMERYGTDNPNYIEGVNERRLKTHINTCMERYGVRNAMQHPEVLARWRAAVSKSEEIELCGKKHNVQGYEGFALEKLNAKRPFANISTSFDKVGHVAYKHKGVERRYFPDAKVKMHDGTIRIIEVKSWFTLANPQNISKFKAATKYYNAKGYEFWLVIADPATDFLRVVCNPKHKLKSLISAASLFSGSRKAW